MSSANRDNAGFGPGSRGKYGAVIEASNGEVRIVSVLGSTLWALRPSRPPTEQDRYELMGAAGTYQVAFAALLDAAKMPLEPQRFFE